MSSGDEARTTEVNVGAVPVAPSQRWKRLHRAAATVLGLGVCALCFQMGVAYLQAAAAGPANRWLGVAVGDAALAASVTGLVLLTVRPGRRVHQVAAWVAITVVMLTAVVLVGPI